MSTVDHQYQATLRKFSDLLNDASIPAFLREEALALDDLEFLLKAWKSEFDASHEVPGRSHENDHSQQVKINRALASINSHLDRAGRHPDQLGDVLKNIEDEIQMLNDLELRAHSPLSASYGDMNDHLALLDQESAGGLCDLDLAARSDRNNDVDVVELMIETEQSSLEKEFLRAKRLGHDNILEYLLTEHGYPPALDIEDGTWPIGLHHGPMHDNPKLSFEDKMDEIDKFSDILLDIGPAAFVSDHRSPSIGSQRSAASASTNTGRAGNSIFSGDTIETYPSSTGEQEYVDLDRSLIALESALLPRNARRMMPCPFHGCHGTDATVSELLARIRNYHRQIICTKCCQRVSVGTHERPGDVQNIHDRVGCPGVYCIGTECAPPGASGLSHRASPECPSWHALKPRVRWQYIYSLINDERPAPDVEFLVGPEYKHGTGRTMLANSAKSAWRYTKPLLDLRNGITAQQAEIEYLKELLGYAQNLSKVMTEKHRDLVYRLQDQNDREHSQQNERDSYRRKFDFLSDGLRDILISGAEIPASTRNRIEELLSRAS